jgi:integrase
MPQSSLGPLRQSTIENNAAFLKNHLLPEFGEIPMAPTFFSRLEIKRFIAAKRKVLADSSLKTGLPILTLILDYAVERGDLPANPMRTGEPLWRAGERADVDPFSASELRSILKAARATDPNFVVLIQLMAQAGLRPGEAMALRRGNVNLEAGTVDIRGTWTRGRFGPPRTVTAPGPSRCSTRSPKTRLSGAQRLLVRIHAGFWMASASWWRSRPTRRPRCSPRPRSRWSR